MTTNTTTRRGLGILAALATSAVVLSGCSASTPSETTELNVFLANHAWTDALKSHIEDYESETGISVNITQMEQNQLEDQYSVKLNAGASDIDVMMYRPLQVAKLYAQNGYVADLSEQVTADAEWEWEDFQKSMRELVTVEDQIVGVPVAAENEVIFYRKDLLEKHGIAAPTTLEELEEAAAAIDDAEPDVAGFVGRTNASAAVTMLSSFLYSLGGDWTDGDASAIDSPEAKEAYAMYGRLVREYGPAQVSTDMQFADAMAIFAQGNAAFYPEASSLYPSTIDPASSNLTEEQVGVLPFPAGSAGSQPMSVAAYALGVNEFSPSKDAAWDFIQWATSQELMAEVQKAGIMATRASTLDDPDALGSMNPELVAAFAANALVGVPYDRPLVINVAQAREIVGAPIVEAIIGGDSDAAADRASEQFQELLDSE
jgi:multiple sugar transport system substrate-binding protein